MGHWSHGRRWLARLSVGAAMATSSAAALGQDAGAPTSTRPVMVPPKLVGDPTVPYPEGASGDASVVLTLTIDKAGGVESAKADVAQEPFSSRAEQAARAFRFEPATRDGTPVAVRIRMVLDFHPPPPEPEVPEPLPEAKAPPKPKPTARPSEAIEEVQVRGARGEPSRTATLSRAEVRQIPGTFGDPFRAIEIMPGVTPIVSGLPFFFVRGAPPGNVGYYLDGVRVPYLFHVGAGPSVVHPGLIDRVDLYSGGYPARYGRYSGGIVAGETLPQSTKLRGEYNVRAFDAGALVEAPFANGKGNVLLGGRYSYTAAILTLLSSSTILDYWDYQARVAYDLSRDDRLSVFAFGAYDFLGEKTATETLTLFGTEFHRVDARYDHKLGNDGSIRTAVTLGIDRTRLQNDRFLRDRLLGTRTELSYRLGKVATLRAGADAQMDRYDIELNSGDLSPSNANIATSFPSRTDLALGARADVVLALSPSFDLTPGVRVDLFTSDGQSALGFDPRLQSRVKAGSRVQLLSALGLAHQPPSFVIPVPGFQPGGLRGGLQKALQESFGVEVDLGGNTTVTATLFHNAFFDMSDALSVTTPQVNGCPPGAFPADTIAGDPGRQPTGNGSRCSPRFPKGQIGPDRSGGGGQASQTSGDAQNARAFETRATGSAYGFELFLKRKLTSRIGGFVSYTLSRSTRTANNSTFIASFDRTHVLNAALAVDLGRNWRAGARGTFYTGLPKAPDPTNPGATRLDPFYKLDLRLEKRWQLNPRFWISAVAEWVNVTFTKESVGTNCTLNGCEEQKVGPVTIPSIGVEGGF